MINETGPKEPGTFLRGGDGAWNLLPLAAIAILALGAAYYFFGDGLSNHSTVPSSVGQEAPKNTPNK